MYSKNNNKNVIQNINYSQKKLGPNVKLGISIGWLSKSNNGFLFYLIVSFFVEATLALFVSGIWTLLVFLVAVVVAAAISILFCLVILFFLLL